MSIFGAPIAHEDHALRACYAALAMQAAMQDYTEAVRRSRGLTLRSRVGLHTGEVVVRTITSDLYMEYSAVGQTTNLASRMEQLADPGHIILTTSTLRLVEGLVQVHALGPVPVKSMTEPVEVYELTGASSIRRRLQAAVARGLTQFVGRGPEMDVLNQALEQAGARQGQIVAAVGEAGVGKSRLLYEFIHSYRTQGWRVLESASVSYGKATPYFPIIDLLRRYVHLEDGDDARTIRAKVTGHILTLDETLQDTIPALLFLLDVLPEDSPFWQLEPPQRRQRTLDALKRILLRESQVQPLVLAFEDLHWIDLETQALLGSLVESLPSTPLLLLVNYRPEYQHGWASKTFYTQLRLDPLPPESAEALLKALLGEDSSLEPLTKLLIERTEGNPFFLEESVRTLVETQVLAGEPGTYCLAQDLPAIQVPPTVQAVLAARIDRLAQDEKSLLQTASVIGNEVPFTLLQAIAEMPDEALHPCLTQLQAAEFLYETNLFPERVYTFKHALTHEVVYGSLLQERRRALHTRIVETLEALASDRVADRVERLAHHALRGEVWNKAVTYCQQVGARAFDHVAYREAVASFEQALQAAAHLPELGNTRGLAIELRLALEGPLNALGEYGRCLALLGEAETLARALDDRVQLGRVLARMAHGLRQTRDLDGALAAGQQALALAVELGESALQAQASIHLGQVYYAIGDFAQAAELLLRSVAAADRGADTISLRLRITSRAWLARPLGARGAFADGRHYGEEALRLATLEARGHTPIAAYACLGELYLTQGDLERAIQLLDQALDLCHTSGNRDWLRLIMAGLGFASALKGRLSEGRALLEEVFGEGIRMGARNAYWVARLSEVCCLAEHREEARQYARQAFDLARQQKDRGGEAYALYQLGVVYAYADPPDVAQAKTHYQQALTLTNELGMRPLQAHCHRGLGTLYSQSGQLEQARTELSTAIEMYRDMEMTFWLPQAEMALTQAE
jgi:tetratricopeptide (TPR) repeat protein